MRPTVELISTGTLMPIEAITLDARTCYRPDSVKVGEVMNVEGEVWATGHHTTLMAPGDFLFRIDGVSVSAITLGLHLAFPFYNSGQRSGRFCGEMFDTLEVPTLVEKIRSYRYQGEALDPALIDEITGYIQFGVNVFQQNREAATDLVLEWAKTDRPHARKFNRESAAKIAQEQLRVFISTLAPTSLIYKINLVGLVALLRTAHTPELQDIIDQMVFLVSQHDPRMSFIFRERGFDSYTPFVDGVDYHQPTMIASRPTVLLQRFDRWPAGCPVPTQMDLHPVDLLHTDPRFMPLGTRNIQTQVKLSLMTMGQDQRHRTISRGAPQFTGEFYLPPIPSWLGLEEQAEELRERWVSIVETAPLEVAAMVAPYGAMVTYEKSGNYKATIHELSKRACWCAQGEIFDLACQLRNQFIAKNPKNPIIGIMAPRCFGGDMRCGEGKRYCGRDIKLQLDPGYDYFAPRRI